MNENYNYDIEKQKLFTDEGQKMVMKAWENAKELLDEAGAFMTFNALEGVDYHNTFTGHAIIDRLVELGYIREVTKEGTVGQCRVYVCAD